MSKKGNYIIEFLFDGEEVSESKLRAGCEKIFRKHLAGTGGGDAEIDINPYTPENNNLNIVRLTLSGPKDSLYSCHQLLHNNKSTFPFNLDSTVQLRNDVGEELREKAYPILAHIEQRLRRFIQERAIEIKGFGWSEDVPKEIRDEVERIEEESDLAHFIDYTYFNDLLTNLVKPPWSGKENLTIEDLEELLNNSDSVEDIN